MATNDDFKERWTDVIPWQSFWEEFDSTISSAFDQGTKSSEHIRELEVELSKCRWHKAHEEADQEIDLQMKRALKAEIENENLLAKNAKLREGLKTITHELGVPQPGYPMPVANAYDVAIELLKEE